MNATDPVQVVKDFFTSFEGNDVNEAIRFVSDDLVYVNVPFGFEAGTVIGPEGMRSVLEPAFATVSRNEFIIRNMAVNGNTVLVERLDRHRVGNSWVELPVMGVFVVVDDRITEWRDYFDMNVFVTQMAAAG